MRMRVLSVLLLAASAAPATAAPESDWMKVLLEGRKIGHLQSTRDVAGDRVTTTERMQLTIDRTGVPITMQSEETSVETRAGQPLEFHSHVALSGLATEIHGVIDGSQLHITIGAGERVEKRTMAWPAGAVMVEGARRLERQHGLAAGTRYELTVFEPSNLIGVPVKVDVGAGELVRSGSRHELLVPVTQRMELPGAPMTIRGWVDQDFELRRATMPLLGLEFELIACSQRCAEAPNQPADILERAMVTAPRALSAVELADGLRYTVDVSGEDTAAPATAAEQNVRREPASARYRIEVDPTPRAPDRTAPVDGERKPTRWLESDAAELIALADEAAGKAGEPAEVMKRLETRVRAHITDKSMRIGYASALETLRAREGDCTEHAVLLAALGRARGIPTRVVNGLAYAGAFAGRQQVFVPHAWVQAWIGDRWASFDAALPGFDAGHIAFSAGDGDPAGFFAGVSLLGNVRIVEAARLPADAVD
jgi:hypothetical protein